MEATRILHLLAALFPTKLSMTDDPVAGMNWLIRILVGTGLSFGRTANNTFVVRSLDADSVANWMNRVGVNSRLAGSWVEVQDDCYVVLHLPKGLPRTWGTHLKWAVKRPGYGYDIVSKPPKRVKPKTPKQVRTRVNGWRNYGRSSWCQPDVITDWKKRRFKARPSLNVDVFGPSDASWIDEGVLETAHKPGRTVEYASPHLYDVWGHSRLSTAKAARVFDVAAEFYNRFEDAIEDNRSWWRDRYTVSEQAILRRFGFAPIGLATGVQIPTRDEMIQMLIADGAADWRASHGRVNEVYAVVKVRNKAKAQARRDRKAARQAKAFDERFTPLEAVEEKAENLGDLLARSILTQQARQDEVIAHYRSEAQWDDFETDMNDYAALMAHNEAVAVRTF